MSEPQGRLGCALRYAGLWRGSSVLVRVVGRDGPIECTFRAITESGERAIAAEPYLGPVLEEFCNATKLRKSWFAEWRAVADYALQAPKDEVFGLRVFADEDEIAPLNQHLSLRALRPRNVSEFRGVLAFAMGRHADTETVRTQCRLVLASDVKSPELRPYVANALVVLTYKSIEIEDVNERELLNWAERVKPLLAEIAPSEYLREDADHNKISVLTALWHLHLYVGDCHAALACMDEIEGIYIRMARRSVSSGNNIALSMCMRALIADAFRPGAKSREAGWNCVIDVFYNFVGIRTWLPMHFREIEVMHKAGYVAHLALDDLRGRGELSAQVKRSIIEACSRVSKGNFQERVRRLVGVADSAAE